MPSSDIILLILVCLVLGAVLGIYGVYKLLQYGLKGLTFDELKAKIDKSLREHDGELKKFDFNFDEKVFEIKIAFPGLEEKFREKSKNG